MAQENGTTKKIKLLLSRLNLKEKTLLSIILMNHGQIPETKLKRIYMEKNTFWDLQSAKTILLGCGFLKIGEDKESGDSVYTISKNLHDILLQVLSLNIAYENETKDFVPEIQTCCEEYSILWFLAQMDYGTDFKATTWKKGKSPRMSLQKAQDISGMNEEDARFVINLITDLSNGKFFKKNGIKKWSDALRSPHDIIKEIYNVVYYELRENGSLGREDVGKDNIDFLMDELELLEIGKWYPFKTFINNSKNTLFSANQPFRWIHFEEDAVWKILDRELRLTGMVQTTKSQDDSKFISPTAMGMYCMGGISEEEFQSLFNIRRGSLLVHPNFEVTLVSKEVHPRILLELCMFSSPVKLDTMSVFKISRESVLKGMDFGLLPEKMLALLNESTKGEVPQNVEYSILDWSELSEEKSL